MGIEDKIIALKERIRATALKVNRDPAGIRLVAVVKQVPADLILRALAAGITEIGENRVQEAETRYAIIKEKYPQARLHMIGHLQRNKVGQALDMFDIIQSVDSPRLAQEMARRAVRPIPILIEVNTSGERSKFGIEPEKTFGLVRFASSFDKLKVEGLMTIGPLTDDPGKTRMAFITLKRLFDDLDRMGLPGVEAKHLSMGMTDDFETAIEEGSNLVRIGRGIFA
jgi:hypothetical protein